MKKYIGNVGLLDIREATPEAVAQVAGVENAGMILYSPESKDLVTQIACNNVGHVAQMDKDGKIVNGNIELDHEALRNANKPVSYLVNGKMVLAPDVTPEDVERGIGRLWINGVAVCPESCVSVLRGHVDTINGEIIPDSGDNQIIMGPLELDEGMLSQLQSPVRYLVLGPFKMLETFDTKLLENVLSLRVYGPVTLRQSHAAALGERLQTVGSKITVLPDDVTLLSDDLQLDASALWRYNKVRLWTNSRLRFAHDVTPEMLKQHIGSLRCTGEIVCRKELKESLFELSENEPGILTYENELVIVDGAQSLSAAELKFRSQSFALVVNGKLTVEEDVDAQVLFDKIEFVINRGFIKCHGDACGALQARMRESKGKIVDMNIQLGSIHMQQKTTESGEMNKDKPKEAEKEYLVRNAGYYKL